MVDTHAHLAVCDPSDAELVAEARAAGVKRILTIGMDAESNLEAVRAADRHQGVFASVGRHPNSAAGFDATAIAEIAAASEHPRVRAIGETGLDFYRDRAPRADQRAAFDAQIEIGRERGLPLVIHVRDREGSSDAVDEVFATLDARAGEATVVLHCFSAPARVEDAAARGWHCSFAGNLTYPGSEPLREAAARLPAELLLVETDSPFLAPQPLRGRPNRPAHVLATAETLAAVRGVTLGELEQLLEANAARVFRW